MEAPKHLHFDALIFHPNRTDLMEPPTSDPTPKTEAAEEMAAASPPEEPPQMRPVW